jgi:hypothetical protein
MTVDERGDTASVVKVIVHRLEQETKGTTVGLYD